jgi:hypothetical protein
MLTDGEEILQWPEDSKAATIAKITLPIGFPLGDNSSVHGDDDDK